MYYWKVKLLMNCGAYIEGFLECNHSESSRVAKDLMKGDLNTFNAIMNKEKTEQILFKTGDVSALMLSAG